MKALDHLVLVIGRRIQVEATDTSPLLPYFPSLFSKFTHPKVRLIKHPTVGIKLDQDTLSSTFALKILIGGRR
jgi:hypothetical protein